MDSGFTLVRETGVSVIGFVFSVGCASGSRTGAERDRVGISALYGESWTLRMVNGFLSLIGEKIDDGGSCVDSTVVFDSVALVIACRG